MRRFYHLAILYLSCARWGVPAAATALLLLGWFAAPAQPLAPELAGSGYALLFNGVNSYVDCGPTNRELRQVVTVEAWVKTSSAAYQGVVSKYADTNGEDKGFYLYLSGGKAGFGVRNGSGQVMNSGPSLSRVDDGRWHHVAGVCRFSTCQVFVDGTLENTVTYPAVGSGLASTAPLLIGCDYVQNGHFFDGELDDVRVFSFDRAEYNIRSTMCRKYDTSPQGLVANYRFDQTSGPILTDRGSRPNDGTMINFSGNPLRLSGAPLGELASNLYLSSWPANTQLLGWTVEGDTIFVSNISAATRGIHVYVVNLPPIITPAGPVAASYFGIFTVGNPNDCSYTLRISPFTGPSCRNAYTRLSNEQQWTLPPPPATSATSLLFLPALYRSEHILTDGPSATAAILGDSVLCVGGRTQLRIAAPSGSQVLWNTGSTAAVLPNVGPGTYTATVRLATGCLLALRRVVALAPEPRVAISGDSTLCPGGTTTLTAAAAGATGYRWSTGATTAMTAISVPGTYTVVTTYGPGCTVSARRTVRLAPTVVLPAFTLGADTTLCEGDATVLQGPDGPGLRYQWSDGSTARQLVVHSAGRYTLRVMAACSEQSASRTLAVETCVQVPNIITANADKQNDAFAVKGLSGEGWALDVYNRWGRAVFHTANYHNDWGSEAAPGVYYVLLRRPSTGYVYKSWVEVRR